MPSPPTLETKLLRYLGRKNYQPLNEELLCVKLKLPHKQKQHLSKVLRQLEEKGKVARIRGDRWVPASDAELVTGVLQFHEKGFAFLIPEDGGEGLFIGAEDTGVAMHQDLVTARISESPAFRGRPARKNGRVIRILKRRHQQVVGTLQRSGLFYYVVPDEPRFIYNIYVPEPGKGKDTVHADIDDKVVVELAEWKSRHNNPEGTIKERLGSRGEPGIDLLSLIHKHQLPMEFPPEALAELAQFAEPEGDAICEDIDDRIDARGDFVITIDPLTAKDFDDAFSIRPAGRGKWDIGIHIADVSYYVKPGSALDKEARERGNSVYLVHKVIPMLPEELSNGLCSLRPDVERLTFAAFVTVTDEGEVIRKKLSRSIIRSRKRLTYEQALERLERKPQSRIDEILHQAHKVAQGLRKRRFSHGALDLDMADVQIVCDDHGTPTEIRKEESDISHQLIEEFMLLANEVVAEQLKYRKLPGMYRVHESPDPERLDELRQTLRANDIKVGDLTKTKEMQKALRLIKNSSAEYSLKIELLKSLRRAEYSAQPMGHYGLAKVNYTHFTSPIRRYCDLVVHRALLREKDSRRRLNQADLEKTAAHISTTERIASDAENEFKTLKKMEFFQSQLQKDRPQSFNAKVLDVHNYGFFVELPDYVVSGLVHVSTLSGDFFHYNNMNRTFKGRKTKTTYRTGMDIRVKVNKIDLFKRQIDFEVAE